MQSRVKKLDKIEKVEPPRRRKVLELRLRPAPRSGDDVVKLERRPQGATARRIIYDGFDLMVRRHERWCVMGVNGAGKSTLLKLIAGETEPDDGARHDRREREARLLRAARDGPARRRRGTVLETLMDAFPLASIGSLRRSPVPSASPGDDVDKPCAILSGGEKARVVLARMLFDPPNLLVLDEPTNHLDIATKDMLVEALANFEGTMIFVSHDRRFLAALSNRVLELGNGAPRVYGGGYTEYVAQSGHEAPGMR